MPKLVHWLLPEVQVDEALLNAIDTGVDLLAMVIAAGILAWLFRRFVLKRVEALAERTDNDVDDRLVYFMRRFYGGIVLFLVLLLALHMLGVQVTPLLAGAGLFGFAVAYASKDVLGNFLSGVFLLLDQPIKIGDRIMIEHIGAQWGSWGDVVDVGLRTTTVRNSDGIHVTYPNAKLAESVIKNFTPAEGRVRFRVRVLLALDNDLQRALDLMVATAATHPAILEDPAPSALVRSLYDESGGHVHHGALVELRCFVEDIRARSRLRSQLLLALHEAFRAEGIGFARLVVGRDEGESLPLTG